MRRKRIITAIIPAVLVLICTAAVALAAEPVSAATVTTTQTVTTVTTVTTTQAATPEQAVIQEQTVAPAGIVDLVIFAGQSNMSGRGGNAGQAPKVPAGTGYEFRIGTCPAGMYPMSEPFGIYSS